MKSRLQLFFTLCLTVFAMTQVQAQERTYSGVVKGSDGKPVAGASVVVIGTSAGTSTGHNGKYTIKARQGSKITYSYLGMKPVTVTTAANTIINVILENDEQALDDVVIIAYGTTKKKDLTGSISTIDSKQISA
jgi:hypothetical protein